MHDKYLLLRRAHDLEAHEKLIVEAWLLNFPKLSTAYRLKESFYDIYDAETKDAALRRYFEWFERITQTPDVVLHAKRNRPTLDCSCDRAHPRSDASASDGARSVAPPLGTRIR